MTEKTEKTGTIETMGNPRDGIVTTQIAQDDTTIIITVTPPEGHFKEGKSPHGAYLTTPGARKLPAADILTALDRFHQGDWGDISQEDHEANEESIREDGLVLASYQSGQTEFWVHQSHRNIPPTVLLPEEH